MSCDGRTTACRRVLRCCPLGAILVLQHRGRGPGGYEVRDSGTNPGPHPPTSKGLVQMARNTNRNARRSNARRTVAHRPVRLSQRGCGVVALVVAGLVALAGTGHHGAAALGAGALYLLVTGRIAAVASLVPSAKQLLRGIAWCAVALAVLAALQGSTAPGGPLLGFACAAALATYLRLTQKR